MQRQSSIQFISSCYPLVPRIASCTLSSLISVCSINGMILQIFEKIYIYTMRDNKYYRWLSFLVRMIKYTVKYIGYFKSAMPDMTACIWKWWARFLQSSYRSCWCGKQGVVYSHITHKKKKLRCWKNMFVKVMGNFTVVSQIFFNFSQQEDLMFNCIRTITLLLSVHHCFIGQGSYVTNR